MIFSFQKQNSFKRFLSFRNRSGHAFVVQVTSSKMRAANYSAFAKILVVPEEQLKIGQRGEKFTEHRQGI